MSLLKNRMKAKLQKFTRRKARVNTKIKAISPEYRLILHKSNLYMSAQLLDKAANVIATFSDKGVKGATKTERAKAAGLEGAKKIVDLKVKELTVDRNGYSYQGRVQAFVDGLREGGVKC